MTRMILIAIALALGTACVNSGPSKKVGQHGTWAPVSPPPGAPKGTTCRIYTAVTGNQGYAGVHCWQEKPPAVDTTATAGLDGIQQSHIYQEVEEGSVIIYFLVFPQGDRTRITVVDLLALVAHERSDWAEVNPETFYTHEEAILAARDIANRHGLTYEPFESRYDSTLDEPAYLY